MNPEDFSQNPEDNTAAISAPNADQPIALEPAPKGPSTLHKIFIGSDGLRAGWSLLIFISILFAIISVSNIIMQKVHPMDKAARIAMAAKPLPPLAGFLQETIPFLLVVLVTWIMSKIERRKNGAYGFGGTRRVRNFFEGLFFGFVTLSLLIFALIKAGLLVIDSRLLSGRDIPYYGAIWFVNFLLVGFFEEYLTRGYLQYTLGRGFAGIYQWIFKTRHSKALGFWSAAAFFSVMFGLGHSSNPGESPIGLLSAGLVGFVFCLSLWRTGSLWWAIGFHGAWDWCQSYLYGVADSGLMVQGHLLATHPIGTPIMSGGSTGPEGSILILPILLIITLIILFTLPRKSSSESV